MNEHKDPSYMDSLDPALRASVDEFLKTGDPIFPHGETNTVREEPERATSKTYLQVGFGLLVALGLAYYLPALLELWK